MLALTGFLQQITGFFEMIIGFFQTLLDGLLSLFKIVTSMFGFIGSFALAFPSYVWVFFAAILAVAVLYIVVGR